MLLYLPGRTMRFFYDVENLQFTLSKLRDELRKIGRVAVSGRRQSRDVRVCLEISRLPEFITDERRSGELGFDFGGS
jgi:hypothetical protein